MRTGLLRTAGIAAIFSAIVLVLLVVNAWKGRTSDPTPPTRVDALVARLSLDPKNKAIQAEIHRQDLWLRSEYLRSQRFAASGFCLLLSGVAVFLLCLQGADKLAKQGPVPEPQAPVEAMTARLSAQRGVLTLSLALGGILASLGALSRHDPMASYFVDARLPAAGESPKQADAPAPALGLQSGGTTLEPLKGGTPLQPLPPPKPSEGTTLVPLSGPVSLGATTSSPVAVVKGEIRAPSAAVPSWASFRGSGAVVGLDKALWSWDVPSGRGVLWKAAVPLPGWNSPVVWGDQVFVTGATEAKREVYAFSLATGKALWRSTIPLLPGAGPMKMSNGAGYAPATVATDGKHVYAMFVNGDLACLSVQGKPRWGRAFGTLDNQYGHASSLVIADGKLFVQLDQGTSPDDKKSRLMALDPESGKMLWEVKRPVAASWSTPLVLKTAQQTMLVTSANPLLIAYDASNGKELWRAEGMSGDVAPSPAFGGGMVFACNLGASLVAIRANDGKVAWSSSDASLADISSPLYAKGLLYLSGSDGTFSAIEATTGKIVWEKKLDKPARSSPILLGDNVCLLGSDGVFRVIEAGSSFHLVASCALGEAAGATPAVVGKRMVLRGEKSLFCVGTP